MALPVSTPLQDDRFLVLETLGRGGMAAVYRAFDRVEQRIVALKVQTRKQPAGPAHPFSAEFDAWSRQSHPNVVQAFELGRARRGPLTSNTPYLVLEHIDGPPIHRALRPGHESPGTVCELAVQLLSGLASVHASGFVHRDLKPSNVLVARRADGRPQVKLTDFGLAVRTGHVGEPGRLSGSLPYVAPEGLLGLPVDGRSDLYSLGILLYELVTGELPLPRATPEELVRWHLGGPPLDPRDVRPEASPRLARFIRRLNSRQRDARPADAAEGLRQLGALRPAQPPAVMPQADRAERAQLRLALDAVRLGALRLHELPPEPSEAGPLRREVRVWSQVHGLLYHRLSANGATDMTPLCRLVLRLLLEQGSASGRLMRRYGLCDLLPVALLGGLPVLERDRPPGHPVRGNGEQNRNAGRALREFLLDCASRRPLVLQVERPALADPLTAALCRELHGAARGAGNPQPGRGGILLLLPRRERQSAAGVSPALPATARGS